MSFLASLGDVASPTWSPQAAHKDDDVTVQDVTSGDMEPFANANNVQPAVKGLLSRLGSLGFSSQLDLFSSKPEDVAAIANTMQQLLVTIQRGRETQDTLTQLVSKLRVDSQASAGERRRLEEQLNEKFTELGTAEIKLRTAARDHSEASRKVQQEVEVLRKRNRQLESSMNGLQVRLRQKEGEAESIRHQLSTAVSKHASRNVRQHGQAHGPQSVSEGGAGHHAAPSSSSAQAEALEADNRALRAQLAQVTADFKRLLARCESLEVGVGASDKSGLGASTASRSAPSMAGASDEQLAAYLATELAVVQERCRALLKRPLNAQPAGAQTDPAHAEADALRANLRDQDKALSAAMARIKRLEAQLEAAQQRASASQQRVVVLEKRLTVATQDVLDANAHVAQAEERAQHAERQLEQQAAQLAALHEVQAGAGGADQGALAAAEARCTALEQEVAAVRQQLAAAHEVAAGQRAELGIVRNQLAAARRVLQAMGRTEPQQQAGDQAASSSLPALMPPPAPITAPTQAAITQSASHMSAAAPAAQAPSRVPALVLDFSSSGAPPHGGHHAHSASTPPNASRKQWEVGPAAGLPRLSPREVLQQEADVAGSPDHEHDSAHQSPEPAHTRPAGYSSQLAAALDLLSPAASDDSDRLPTSAGPSPFSFS